MRGVAEGKGDPQQHARRAREGRLPRRGTQRRRVGGAAGITHAFVAPQPVVSTLGGSTGSMKTAPQASARVTLHGATLKTAPLGTEIVLAFWVPIWWVGVSKKRPTSLGAGVGGGQGRWGG